MATQKPISSISYNSESFLREKLEAWKEAHIIQAYMYVCHKGEDGDKDHIHFRVEPNKKLDPMDLQEALREFVAGNPKPLGCRPFRPSKEEDWILYAVHDEKYLAQKYSGGEKGEKIPYKWEDIKAPEDYDVEVAYIRAKAHLEHTTVNVATRLQNGENALSLVLQGENVYTVNQILKTLSGNDYTRLQGEKEKLQKELAQAEAYIERLEEAILEAGLEIAVQEDGTYKII